MTETVAKMNQSINNYFFVSSKADQRAGQVCRTYRNN